VAEPFLCHQRIATYSSQARFGGRALRNFNRRPLWTDLPPACLFACETAPVPDEDESCLEPQALRSPWRGKVKPAPGKSLGETTKELVETLKVSAIKNQGYAFRELMEKYVNDRHGLERLRAYKEQFERDAVLPDSHNAHYRIRMR
jgi:hypothetical protein